MDLSHLCQSNTEWAVLLWTLILLFTLNRFRQTSHLKGFSPVWIRWCSLSLYLFLNVFLQTSHSKGFTPIWILLWACSFQKVRKSLLHSWHVKNCTCEENSVPEKEKSLIKLTSLRHITHWRQHLHQQQWLDKQMVISSLVSLWAF